MARAQTNIDQGKSASQLFSNACAECHKSASALRKGKSAAAVAEFLREHYTTGREQAASLAAYVVGGRDTVAAPTPGQKPPAERAQKPPKAEEGATANARPRRPAEANAKPNEEAPSIPTFVNPIARPEPSQIRPTATRNRRKEQVTPTPEQPQEPAEVAHAPPAAAVTEPPRPETPAPEAAPVMAAPRPTAAAPMETPPGESGEPVPRDNIPD